MGVSSEGKLEFDFVDRVEEEAEEAEEAEEEEAEEEEAEEAEEAEFSFVCFDRRGLICLAKESRPKSNPVRRIDSRAKCIPKVQGSTYRREK